MPGSKQKKGPGKEVNPRRRRDIQADLGGLFSFHKLLWGNLRTRLEFHGGLPPVIGNLCRAQGTENQGVVTLIARVRTTDTEPDMGFIYRTTENSQEPRLRITLEHHVDGNLYAISMGRIPSSKSEEAMIKVDEATRRFLMAKEIAQDLAGEDTKQLMSGLRGQL